MKILYVTTPGPSSQGDFQENMILHGLREIISTGVVDYPRKKIMYNDFSETVREEIHGRGFTLYTVPLLDLNREQRKMSHLDVILYGVTDAYGVTDFPNINQLCKNIWYVDGHDTSDIKKTPCFKRELFEEQKNVYPTGFGIPDYQIRAIDLDNKDQKFQTTAPAEAFFKPEVMRHLVNYYTYTWEQEKEYYQDMQRSWFGLSCKKGGWDSLRHYEIMASGALLLFREYDKKPDLCAPQNLPCFSYGSLEELDDLTNRLVINNKPTKEYIEMLLAQRDWLSKFGTTKARALDVLKVLAAHVL
tara:strand:- start:731 stop:1636 length:906 start_codon:yes stop_codon:yes gene_type:complete